MQNLGHLKAIRALSLRQASALNRKRVVVSGRKGTSIIMEDKVYLSFASNDYLGLSQHPKMLEAHQAAANLYGVGSFSSPLLCGHSKAHQCLEEELAEFSGFPRTLVFSSGYMANLAIIGSFVTKHDQVFSDRHNHASLIDAIQLSSAKLLRYPHLNFQRLQKLIEDNGLRNSSCYEKDKAMRNRWIVAEGVYSVDGDISPLPALQEIAETNQCRLILDDAHAFGVLGKEGRGTLSHYAMGSETVSLVSGSFSKAFGCFGAFIGAKEDMIEALVQFARPYIYSSALPAALAESLRVSLKLMMQEEWRREKLQVLIARFRAGAIQLGIKLMSSLTPIQIILIGNSTRVMIVSDFLKKKGIVVAALRPPTVAIGQDRLRITLSALHTEDQVDRLLLALEAAQKL
jgi:8-amino-7-oxononanoate synthase